jgi:hypothetical protein
MTIEQRVKVWIRSNECENFVLIDAQKKSPD